MRASDVPRFVQDENSTVGIGITGSDIIWEAGLGKDSGEEIPLYQFNPCAKQSALYIGITKRLKDLLGKNKLEITDLVNSQIATKFPLIAGEFFSERKLSPDLILVPGADEAMQYIFPNCNGVLGVLSSGDTIKANNIDIVETFYNVTLRMIKSEGKLSNNDLLILNEFQEKISVALQRKRMI